MTLDPNEMTLREFREKYPFKPDDIYKAALGRSHVTHLKVTSWPWYDPHDSQVYVVGVPFRMTDKAEWRPEIVNVAALKHEVTIDDLRCTRELPSSGRCTPILQYMGGLYVVSYDDDERQFTVGYSKDEMFSSPSLDAVEQHLMRVINDGT
jgi:hypothetical protein